MTVNVDLLNRTLDYIENNPHQWDQSMWAIEVNNGITCDTAFCFAGWAVQLNGHTIKFDASDGYFGVTQACCLSDVNEYIEYVAEKELGLTTSQASQLFDGDNSLADLRRIVAEFIDDAHRTQHRYNSLPDASGTLTGWWRSTPESERLLAEERLALELAETNEPVPVA